MGIVHIYTAQAVAEPDCFVRGGEGIGGGGGGGVSGENKR